MNNFSRLYGVRAEDCIGHYLQALGYEIIANNWYFGHREIDLIAKSKQLTVFVEVKSGKEGLDPFWHFTKKKQKDLSLAINAYLDQANLWDSDFRADLITLTFGKQGNIATLKHYEEVI